MSVDLSAQHTPAVSAETLLRLLAEGAKVGSLMRVRLVLPKTCGFVLHSVFWYDFVHDVDAETKWRSTPDPRRHRLLNTISTATARASRSKRSNGGGWC
jgi:hypothetical protein